MNKGAFAFNKAIALQLHAITEQDEALEWGKFRSGYVTIAGSNYEPPLDKRWLEVEQMMLAKADVYDQAITAFLQMVRAQFFWDMNKRMGRFMMNGILLSNGFPIINVPAKRQQEFNRLMLDFYLSDNMQPMNQFLRSCMNEKIIKNFQVRS